MIVNTSDSLLVDALLVRVTILIWEHKTKTRYFTMSFPFPNFWEGEIFVPQCENWCSWWWCCWWWWWWCECWWLRSFFRLSSSTSSSSGWCWMPKIPLMLYLSCCCAADTCVMTETGLGCWLTWPVTDDGCITALPFAICSPTIVSPPLVLLIDWFWCCWWWWTCLAFSAALLRTILKWRNKIGCDIDASSSHLCRLSTKTNLLMDDTLGTLSWEQMPSVSSLSRISHANMVGFSRL